MLEAAEEIPAISASVEYAVPDKARQHRLPEFNELVNRSTAERVTPPWLARAATNTDRNRALLPPHNYGAY